MKKSFLLFVFLIATLTFVVLSEKNVVCIDAKKLKHLLKVASVTKGKNDDVKVNTLALKMKKKVAPENYKAYSSCMINCSQTSSFCTALCPTGSKNLACARKCSMNYQKCCDICDTKYAITY